MAETQLQELYTSVYMEYSGKIKDFNYSLGLQGDCSRFNQEGKGYRNHSFLPRIQLTCHLSDNVHIRYQGQISKGIPALSDLNDVEQLIDSLQIHCGSPELKMPAICNNTLNIDYRKGLSGSSLHLPYHYQQTPAMGMSVFTFSRNVSFGRKYASAGKRLRNEDYHAGTLKSRK